MSSSPHSSSENSASQPPQSGKIRLGLIVGGTASLILTFVLGWRFSNADAVRSPSQIQSETPPQLLTETPPVQPEFFPTPTFKVLQPNSIQGITGNLRPGRKNLTENSEQTTTIFPDFNAIVSFNFPAADEGIQPVKNDRLSEKLSPKISGFYEIHEAQTAPIPNSNENLYLEHFRAKIEPKKLTISQAEPEIKPEPERENFTPDSSAVQLGLRDTIFLALENNREIKNQYLERIVQREDLAVAEDKFVPDFTPRIALDWENLEQGGTSNTRSGGVLSARLEMKIPTGAQLNFGWEGQRQNRTGEGLSGQDRNSFQQNIELSFTQPLLRGGGIDLNQASIKIARINETINWLDLKLILIDKITEAILAYRALLQAQERLKIEQTSLEIAEQQVENTQILIDAGRQARVDLVPVQTRVANQEISLLDAENNLQQRRLELLGIIDLDESINIVAIEEVTAVEFQDINFENIQQIALENRPDYLKAKLNAERSQFQLQIAENERRWNLDLSANVNRDLAPNIVDQQTELRAGIELKKTLGDRNIERDFQRSRVDVLQTKNDLEEELQQIEIKLQNAIRQVNDNFKTVELTQRATRLAEEQFSNEQEKIKLGAGDSSVVDLVRFQEDLGIARNRELNAKIEYLNSITELNRVVGTTLEFWNITLERSPETSADE